MKLTVRTCFYGNFDNWLSLPDLIDTILQLHTVELRASTLSLALSQLRTYLERFRVRLAATHALQLRRLIHFLTALSQYVEDLRCREESLSKIMSVTSFTEELGNKVNDINLVDLQSYLQASKVYWDLMSYQNGQSICLEGNSQNLWLCETQKGRPRRFESRLIIFMIN